MDPRTKLIIVMCLSTLGLFFTDVYKLSAVFVIGIIVSKILGGNLYALLVRIRKIIYLLFFIVVIQSFFTKGGSPILSIGDFNIITDIGLEKGLGYFLRVLIIITSGVIITTSRDREMIQGIVQFGLPYEFAFMTAVGIKFMPLLVEEFKDTYTAIQLKGIEIKSLPLIERFKISSYILTPVIASTINKGKKLSISVESRGFRVYDKRTSLVNLKFCNIDYLLILFTVITTFIAIYIN
jgi:energy-coupling factor transport system permease protein